MAVTDTPPPSSAPRRGSLSTDRRWREWMMVATGLVGLARFWPA